MLWIRLARSSPRRAAPPRRRRFSPDRRAPVGLVALAALAAPAAADDLEELREKLEKHASGSQDYFVARGRQAAVRGLAELGTPEAWELVVDALDDPSPRVADEAQLALSGVRDPEVVETLAGRDGLRARDPWVQRRVAEALGRLRVEVEADLLERALGEREDEVRRALFWSVERLARAERLVGDVDDLREECRRAARRDRRPEVRAAALRAWAELGELPREHLLEALEDDRPPVRATAADLLGRRGGRGAAADLRQPAGDPEPLVRLTALEALCEVGDKDALLALIDRLEAEPRKRLRLRLEETLQGMTGRLYRQDPRPWRYFAERLPSDWRAGSSPPPPPRASRAAAAFAGLPVHSDRVAFLIDFSGSIWMEQEDGRTRKEQVDGELEKTLAALPPETRFNLVAYSDEPKPWREALVEARPANLKRAREWFAKCHLDGRGNVFDAVLCALQDPAVDTLVILTDGAPTGGNRWNVRLMADLLAERNRAHGVAIDAVLVGTGGRLLEDWKALCARTGGSVVVVDW